VQKKDPIPTLRSKVLVLLDESNVSSCVRTAGRGLDWLKLRDFLAGPNTGRDLIEMVVYTGLPPAIPTWQEERDRKNKFVHWLRSNGFMVVTKDGASAEEGHYKANVDVMMAIDALELFHRDAARCRDPRDWRRRFCLSRYQTAQAQDPRGGRVNRRKSRTHIEISR
jgi:NYN domain-containing protein